MLYTHSYLTGWTRHIPVYLLLLLQNLTADLCSETPLRIEWRLETLPPPSVSLEVFHKIPVEMTSICLLSFETSPPRSGS